MYFKDTQLISDILEDNIKKLENVLNKDYYLSTASSILKNKQLKEKIDREVVQDINVFYKMLKEKVLWVWREDKKIVIDISQFLPTVNFVDKYILVVQLIWDKVADFLKKLGKVKWNIDDTTINQLINYLWIKDKTDRKNYKDIIKKIYSSNNNLLVSFPIDLIRQTIFFDFLNKHKEDDNKNWNYLIIDKKKIQDLLKKYSKNQKTLKDLWVQRKYIVRFLRKANPKINYYDYLSDEMTIFEDDYKWFISEPDRIEELHYKEFMVKYTSTSWHNEDKSLDYAFNNLFISILENLYVLVASTNNETQYFSYVVKLYVNYLTQSKIFQLLNSNNSWDTIQNRFIRYKQNFLSCYYYGDNTTESNRVLDVIDKQIKVNVWIIHFINYIKELIQNYDFDNDTKEIVDNILGKTLVNKSIRFTNGDTIIELVVDDNGQVKVYMMVKKTKDNKSKAEKIPIVFSLIYEFNYLLNVGTILIIKIPKWSVIKIWDIMYKVPSEISREIDLNKINMKRCKELNLEWLLLPIIYLENTKLIFDVLTEVLENNIDAVSFLTWYKENKPKKLSAKDLQQFT